MGSLGTVDVAAVAAAVAGAVAIAVVSADAFALAVCGYLIRRSRDKTWS